MILFLFMSVEVYINDININATSLIYDVDNQTFVVKTDELFENGFE